MVMELEKLVMADGEVGDGAEELRAEELRAES
jgi:hypothetical protein